MQQLYYWSSVIIALSGKLQYAIIIKYFAFSKLTAGATPNNVVLSGFRSSVICPTDDYVFVVECAVTGSSTLLWRVNPILLDEATIFSQFNSDRVFSNNDITFILLEDNGNNYISQIQMHTDLMINPFGAYDMYICTRETVCHRVLHICM